MTTSGWIGVDLDGTLAEYHGWPKDNGVGKPIPLMVERVKKWVADGIDVRIFTARVSIPEGVVTFSADSGRHADTVWVKEQTKIIQDWLEANGLPRLKVTCQKDFALYEFWDDRCVQVVANTGETIVDFVANNSLNINKKGE